MKRRRNRPDPEQEQLKDAIAEALDALEDGNAIAAYKALRPFDPGAEEDEENNKD